MFETDRLSAEHARRCNAMDEVWVPTGFHRDTFARWGVLPEKCAPSFVLANMSRHRCMQKACI